MNLLVNVDNIQFGCITINNNYKIFGLIMKLYYFLKIFTLFFYILNNNMFYKYGILIIKNKNE
jgi:hypothetical protein